jgi:hypothetical protein
MVRGGAITTDQSDNPAQSRITTHGQNSKTRHHNRSQKVRRENQQQEPLGDPKTNAWAASKQKIMKTKNKKLMTVKNRLVQDRSGVIVKVIAVPIRRPLINQRQYMPKTTRRENKKNKKKGSS